MILGDFTDLEFKTIINDEPAIIKIPNGHFNINIFIEDGHREIICTMTAIDDIEEEH